MRSGGLKGGRSTWVFDADRPPPAGFSRADVQDILQAAGNPALRSMPAQSPGNPCCDRYVYLVTIRYPDGATRSFHAVDGDQHPAPLDRLLHLLAA